VLYGLAGLAVGAAAASVAYYGLNNEKAKQVRTDHIPRYADKPTMLKVRNALYHSAKQLLINRRPQKNFKTHSAKRPSAWTKTI
jgi:hypothetical protein